MDVTDLAPVVHAHDGSDITTGTISNNRLDTGSGNGLDADTVDGMHATDFVASDSNTSFANQVVRQGAKLIYLSDNEIRVDPGVLGFPDGKVRKATDPLTWGFGNGVGPLGLDDGVEAVDTWYYMYAVPDPSDDAVFTVIASTAEPIAAGGAGPAAPYDLVYRFIGSFKNNAGGLILFFYRSGAEVHFRGDVFPWRNISGAQPSVDTWLTIDISFAVPATADAAMLNGVYDAWGNAAILHRVAPELGGSSLYFCVDWQNGAGTCDVTIPVVNRSFVYMADIYSGWTNDANQQTSFHVRGYHEDLGQF